MVHIRRDPRTNLLLPGFYFSTNPIHWVGSVGGRNCSLAGVSDANHHPNGGGGGTEKNRTPAGNQLANSGYTKFSILNLVYISIRPAGRCQMISSAPEMAAAQLRGHGPSASESLLFQANIEGPPTAD